MSNPRSRQILIIYILAEGVNGGHLSENMTIALYFLDLQLYL